MIVVTGATGNVGGELLRLLSERGAGIRALSRSPPRADPLPGVEWAGADLADRGALPGVFAGAERLFLLTGNVGDMVLLQKNAIAAAAILTEPDHEGKRYTLTGPEAISYRKRRFGWAMDPEGNRVELWEPR